MQGLNWYGLPVLQLNCGIEFGGCCLDFLWILTVTLVRSMNHWISIVTRSVISLGILAMGGLGIYLLGKPEVPTAVPEKSPPPRVEAVPALSHRDGITFEVDGVVVPYREIQIAAQVSGKVEFKSDHCQSGRTVNKGDVLLRIERNDYELEVRRLSEELTQADAMIAELDAEITSTDNQISASKQQLEIDQRQLKRNEDLARRSAASSFEVDNARKAVLVTRTTLQSLVDQNNLLTRRRVRMQSGKALVQANLDKAKLNLQRTEIQSPIDGVIVSESVEQDGYVQPGSSMIVLQDTSQFDVSCKLYMRQMNWLWQTAASETAAGDSVAGDSAAGDSASQDSGVGYDFPETPATVVYQLGDQSYAWDAIVDRYDGAGIDSQTRMVACRVHVDDPTGVRKLDPAKATDQQRLQPVSGLSAKHQPESPEPESKQLEQYDDEIQSRASEFVARSSEFSPPTLMTGMFVKVRIHAAPPLDLVQLPQQAIQPGNRVWIVEDEALHSKEITIASANEDYVVAYQSAGGLNAGDQVVISPLTNPMEGMPVSTKEEPKASRRGPPGADGKSENGGRRS